MRYLMNKMAGFGASLAALAALLVGLPHVAEAGGVLGEYSYLHVSFSSVWHIFIFILVLVMMPFILMIYHVWRHGPMKGDADRDGVSDSRRENEEEQE